MGMNFSIILKKSTDPIKECKPKYILTFFAYLDI